MSVRFSPSRIRRAAALVAALTALSPGASFAASGTYSGSVSTQKQMAQTAVHADRFTSAALAQAMQAFSAGVGRYAYEAFAGVPWNQNQTTTPIVYQTMRLYSMGSGYAGNPSTDCAFPSNPPGATSLPSGLAGPTNLGAPVSFGASSQQAQAIESGLGGNQQFLPANFGASWNGVFCATVQMNAPTAKQIAITTWYVPGASATNAAPTNAAATPDTMSFESAQSVTSAAAKAIPGASVLYGGGSQSAWNAVK